MYDFALVTLLLILPCNFILFNAEMSLQLSSLVLFCVFSFLLLVSKFKLLAIKTNFKYFALIIILFSMTIVNYMYFDVNLSINNAIVFTFANIQLFCAFAVGYFLSKHVQLNFIFKMFLFCVFFMILRILISDFESVFKFSVIRDERVFPDFSGGGNNSAIISSIACIVAYNTISNKAMRLIVSVFFFFFIVICMSRGALFSFVITVLLFFFINLLMQKKISTLKSGFNALMIFFIIVLILPFFNTTKYLEMVERISNRFLGIFSAESSIEEISSGRSFILLDIFSRIQQSSWVEILLGNGFGSVLFTVNDYTYHTTHNIYVDILYQHGLIFFLLYFGFLVYIFRVLVKNITQCNKTLFFIFMLLHVNIFFNPFIYSIQVGWIYAFFMALIYKDAIEKRKVITHNNLNH